VPTATPYSAFGGRKGATSWARPSGEALQRRLSTLPSDMWTRNEKRSQIVETQADKMFCAQADAADPLHYAA